MAASNRPTSGSSFGSSLFPPKTGIETLLQYIADGKHNEASQLIVNDPALLYQKAKVKDKSGREFESISAIQYAAWSLDHDMCKQIMQALAYSTKIDERAKEKIYQDLKKQNDERLERGVVYQLNEKHITETQFQTGGILKALLDCKNQVEAHTPLNHDLLRALAEAQRLLPANIARFYLYEPKDSSSSYDRLFLPTTWHATKGDEARLNLAPIGEKETNDRVKIERVNRIRPMDKKPYVRLIDHSIPTQFDLDKLWYGPLANGQVIQKGLMCGSVKSVNIAEYNTPSGFDQQNIVPTYQYIQRVFKEKETEIQSLFKSTPEPSIGCTIS